jgi:hypothetical protein
MSSHFSTFSRKRIPTQWREASLTLQTRVVAGDALAVPGDIRHPRPFEKLSPILVLKPTQARLALYARVELLCVLPFGEWQTLLLWLEVITLDFSNLSFFSLQIAGT